MHLPNGAAMIILTVLITTVECMKNVRASMCADQRQRVLVCVCSCACMCTCTICMCATVWVLIDRVTFTARTVLLQHVLSTFKQANCPPGSLYPPFEFICLILETKLL